MHGDCEVLLCRATAVAAQPKTSPKGGLELDPDLQHGVVEDSTDLRAVKQEHQILPINLDLFPVTEQQQEQQRELEEEHLLLQQLSRNLELAADKMARQKEAVDTKRKVLSESQTLGDSALREPHLEMQTETSPRTAGAQEVTELEGPHTPSPKEVDSRIEQIQTAGLSASPGQPDKQCTGKEIARAASVIATSRPDFSSHGLPVCVRSFHLEMLRRVYVCMCVVASVIQMLCDWVEQAVNHLLLLNVILLSFEVKFVDL